MAKRKPKSRTRKEWEIEINLLAWKDPQFKKFLLQNPQEALEQIGCRSGLDPKKVLVLEESDDGQILVLHKKPRSSEEISEEDFRMLATGNCEGQSACVHCYDDNGRSAHSTAYEMVYF